MCSIIYQLIFGERSEQFKVSRVFSVFTCGGSLLQRDMGKFRISDDSFARQLQKPHYASPWTLDINHKKMIVKLLLKEKMMIMLAGRILMKELLRMR